MFDVDKLKEAVAEATEDVNGQAEVLVSAEPYPTILDAARMMVAGQPLWWCEEHRASAKGLDEDVFCDRWAEIHDCRIVEGWWMPTGEDET